VDDTKEFVSAATIRTALLVIGIGGPILGAAAGLAMGIARHRILPALLRGLGIGLLGLLCLGLWFLYNGVLGRMGFDSVAGLLLNLGLFAVVGVIVGVVVALLAGRERAPRADG
jgi:hypothetical protein